MNGEAALAGGQVIVRGKPRTEVSKDHPWHDALTTRVPRGLRNPHLTFTRKDRSQYDLDNLVFPVVDISGRSYCESIWATVEHGADEGVLIRECVPPPPPTGAQTFSVHIAHPSTECVPNRPPAPELEGVATFGSDEPLGLALEFDGSDVAVGEMSWVGPTKSLIDDLAPLLGQRWVRGRLEAEDRRVRELRITRGHAPRRSGVTVTLWCL